MNKLPKVTISDLLDAGVHYGHKISRWNPKMAPYLYGIRDDIHIIDLQQTLPLLYAGMKTIYDVVRNNGKVLFVGTKVQASEIVAEHAERSGQYYVNHRWLGGMMTNWSTVSQSIKKLESLEKILNDEETSENYTKKEILEIERKKDKLLLSLGGIRNINGKPDLVVVIDTNKEKLAVAEAKTLGIPVVGIIDSNSNPDGIDFPIPGNDDAIRSIKLFCSLFADAALAGIEDSLAASGVDLGAVAGERGERGGDRESRAAKTVAKLKSNKKVTTPAGAKAPSEKKATEDNASEEVSTKAKRA